MSSSLDHLAVPPTVCMSPSFLPSFRVHPLHSFRFLGACLAVLNGIIDVFGWPFTPRPPPPRPRTCWAPVLDQPLLVEQESSIWHPTCFPPLCRHRLAEGLSLGHVPGAVWTGHCRFSHCLDKWAPPKACRHVTVIGSTALLLHNESGDGTRFLRVCGCHADWPMV